MNLSRLRDSHAFSNDLKSQPSGDTKGHDWAKSGAMKGVPKADTIEFKINLLQRAPTEILRVLNGCDRIQDAFHFPVRRHRL